MIREKLSLALADCWDGASGGYYWGLLGWHDIKQRYRRSVIGPFWITLSTGVMVAALGFMYSRILSQPVAKYLPYLAVGLVTWNYIATVINESCLVFISSEASIKNVPVPLTAHVLRIVWRNLIVLAHNFVIILVVLLFFQVQIGWESIMALGGILLMALNGFWMGLLLGTICARFRDIPQIVANITQAVFFLTPIIWRPNVLSAHSWAVYLNPFYYLIEVIRAPLIGEPLPTGTLLATCIITFGGLIGGVMIFARFRSRVPYWL